jgi:tetratricopeptide (TPR) repeat protein
MIGTAGPEPSSIDALRELGLASHERGDLRTAEAAYRSVLQEVPNDREIKYGLGVLALQTGRYELGAELVGGIVAAGETAAARVYLGNALEGLSRSAEALENYERAIALDPSYAPAYLSRGHGLRVAGRRADALASYEKAIDIDPGFFEALIGRAEVLRESADPVGALEAYRRAIDARPADASAHLACARLLLELGEFRSALSSIERAIQLGLNSPEAETTQGLAQSALGQRQAALDSFDRALALKADYAPAHINRAAMLRRMNRFEEAFEAQTVALTLEPNNFAARANRASLLLDLGRYDEALASCEQIAAAWPEREHEILCHRGAALLGVERADEALLVYRRADVARASAQAHVGLAAALQALQRPAEALPHCDQAISLAPESAEAHLARGHALTELARINDAQASYRTALALDPGHDKAAFALGCAHLLEGDYDRGWALYERRPGPRPVSRARGPSTARWTGEQDLNGRSLLIDADQGFGDTIQFSRYALLAESRGARVSMSVPAPLRELLSTLSPTIQILGEAHASGDFDLHCPLSSLPRAFRTTLPTIPVTQPYLKAAPRRIESWRQAIAGPGLKLGICWQEPQSRDGRGQFFPVNELSLATVPGVRLVSLQIRDGRELRTNLPPEMDVPGLSAQRADWLDEAAALIECVDLVITCDATVAHLAGALGRSAWVALRHVPDWRWTLDRSVSPWYPTLRLFRQSTPGGWRDVFTSMHRELLAPVLSSPPHAEGDAQ